LLGHLDALGLGRNPIKDLWELVPWSFVFDWVVGIGPALSRFDSPLLQPSVAVHRFCYSTTINREILVDFSVGARTGTEYSNCDGGPAGRYVTVLESAYKRIIVNPVHVIQTINTSGLSRKEAILASALLLSRRGRGRKH